LEIREEIQDDITIYQLSGRLDTNTSPELEIRLFQAISDGSQNMVINFTAYA
jgi:anti-anti-sigma regulatory factor